MDSMDQVGKKLKKARLQAKLTQAQVAEKIEVHVNYYDTSLF
jgi:transcriptional regulator with XRE-family HTH domain